MVSKKEIRDIILDIRKSFDTTYLNTLSEIICKRVIKQPTYEAAKNLVLYMPINNEVCLDILMTDGFSRGKSIWLPRVIDKQMDFFSYTEATKLLTGAYNIKEPDSDIILTPDENTLIIMPGAAFSEDMGRIGYGGGYYDKYLSKHTCCKTIAVGYNFQILPMVPMEEQDVKPDIIITDQSIFYKESKGEKAC